MIATILQRSKRAGGLLLRAPSLLVIGLAYSALLYSVSLRTHMLDVGNPWWGVSVGIVLLVLPIADAFMIRKTAAFAADQSFGLRDFPIESYADMVLGGLLVNAIVIAGMSFLLVPGIYFALRSLYFKQLILLHKARPLAAVRISFQMMVSWRAVLSMFAILGLSYSVPLAIGTLLPLSVESIWFHVTSAIMSAVVLAWVNAFITLSFIDARDEAQRLGTDENVRSA